VDVIRHHYVARDYEAIAQAHGFQRVFDRVTGARGAEILLPVIAAEGDEVKMAYVLVADESFGHGGLW
jgi:hypothetical protein